MLCGLSSQAIGDEPHFSMYDPYIALEFDSRSTKFDLAPPALAHTLKSQPKHTWLFGYFDDSSSSGRKYYVVAALIPDYNEENGMMRGYVANQGGLIISEAENYKFIGMPDMIDDLGLPKRVVNGLAHDVVERLMRAFGGKSALQIAIAEKKVRLDGIAHLSSLSIAEALREAGITNVCVEEKCGGTHCLCQ